MANGRLRGYVGALYRRFWRSTLNWTLWPDPLRVRGYTHCSLARLRALQRHVATIHRSGIPGVAVECGVAEGGSAAAIALALQRADDPRPLILFDTFAGLPPPSANDPDYDVAVEFTGACAGSVADVRQLFATLRLPEPVCIPGLFEHIVAETETGPIALLHLDGDWYDSTMSCLRALWPRLVEGGILQIDDYGYWQGCQKAVTEYLGPQAPLEHIDGVGVWLQKSNRFRVPGDASI